MATIKHDVVVHKAALTLMANESLAQFTRILTDLVKQHLVKKQGLPSKGADVYCVEVFPDSVIANVYWYGDTAPANGARDKYFAVPYTRDAKGVFTFGSTTEVKRVTRFEPVQGEGVKTVTSTTKSTGLMEFGNEQSKWLQTTKSLWLGAVS